MTTISKTKSTMLLAAVIGIFTVLYCSLIFNQNIWTDEAFTIELTRQNRLLDIIRQTAIDVHPPLYYLIVKIFISLFGSSFQLYKLVSILPMLLTMLLSVTHIRPWFGVTRAVLFLVSLNAIPCVMEYSVQIRMYSWCIFFITLAGLSAYGVYTQDTFKQYCSLTLSALCACYTHNFAMISAVMLYLLLGIAMAVRRKKFPVRWLLSGAVVGAGFLPWLPVLLRQTGSRVGNYWIEPVTMRTILGYFSDLFGSRLPYTAALFGVLFICAVFFLKDIRREERFVALLALVPALTALVGILVSVLITPFFIARYLVPCTGLIALFLAVSFGGGLQRRVSLILLSAFLAVMAANAYYTNVLLEYDSTHTDEVLSYLEEAMEEDDIILYNNQEYGFIYECYFESDRLCFLGDMDFEAAYHQIWYLDSCVSPWLPEDVLQTHGLVKEYIATLGIEQNDFILYRIYRK
ncbi:MAG: glycosyltransferase family 39 protein [Lachnospiraceae bacterium]|nr:glycosyltransferase family 39 protein [Lachnospiraceae bacterium]